ncbi:MAG: hypothetical protein IJS39_14955 [Synergistaceae bacterium]|nr:hypothetical protein [Synergistaceae bacterium]
MLPGQPQRYERRGDQGTVPEHDVGASPCKPSLSGWAGGGEGRAFLTQSGLQRYAAAFSETDYTSASDTSLTKKACTSVSDTGLTKKAHTSTGDTGLTKKLTLQQVIAALQL